MKLFIKLEILKVRLERFINVTILLSYMVEFTRLSSKGQIIIPQAIRDRMNLEKGTMFAVMQTDDSLCLKKVTEPKINWEEIAKPFREAAKKSNFTQEDLFKIMEESRKKR
jgi:AbrB family looped-hinge helix DNA binding protein